MSGGNAKANGKERGGMKFVGYVPGEKVTTAKSAPRLAHRKSRTGCHRCRARRVKCNEVHPACGACQRHQLPCIYESQSTTSKGAEETVAAGAGAAPSRAAGSLDATEDLLESQSRRKLELRLMQQWITRTALNFAEIVDHTWRDVLQVQLPELALQHDALLYSIYSFSALHIALTTTDDVKKDEALDAYRRYLDLAIRDHQAEINNLSANNADAVYLTSCVIRHIHFAIQQERPIEPGSPPSDWLYMMKGSADVLSNAWEFIGDNDASLARIFAKGNPDISDRAFFLKESNGENLKHLLRRTCGKMADEPWGDEIEATYNLAIRYIGGLKIAFESGDTAPDELYRRTTWFPLIVGKGFIELVEAKRPRALIILAYYFAFLDRLRRVWWIGNMGRREIRGLNDIIPSDWVWIDMLSWANKAIDNEPIAIENKFV